MFLTNIILYPTLPILYFQIISIPTNTQGNSYQNFLELTWQAFRAKKEFDNTKSLVEAVLNEPNPEQLLTMYAQTLEEKKKLKLENDLEIENYNIKCEKLNNYLNFFGTYSANFTAANESKTATANQLDENSEFENALKDFFASSNQLIFNENLRTERLDNSYNFLKNLEINRLTNHQRDELLKRLEFLSAEANTLLSYTSRCPALSHQETLERELREAEQAYELRKEDANLPNLWRDRLGPDLQKKYKDAIKVSERAFIELPEVQKMFTVNNEFDEPNARGYYYCVFNVRSQFDLDKSSFFKEIKKDETFKSYPDLAKLLFQPEGQDKVERLDKAWIAFQANQKFHQKDFYFSAEAIREAAFKIQILKNDLAALRIRHDYFQDKFLQDFKDKSKKLETLEKLEKLILKLDNFKNSLEIKSKDLEDKFEIELELKLHSSESVLKAINDLCNWSKVELGNNSEHNLGFLSYVIPQLGKECEALNLDLLTRKDFSELKYIIEYFEKAAETNYTALFQRNFNLESPRELARRIDKLTSDI